MNELLKELKNKQLNRCKGRTAVIRNPYYTKISKDTKVHLNTYVFDNELDDYVCIIEYANPNSSTELGFDSPWLKGSCLFDELNFIDKEYSGSGLFLKGVRNERKDKYGSTLVVELLNDTKTIYISQSLSSTLLCTNDNDYIGFATDPDEKATYIFKARDDKEGYLLNKANNRIISIADHRELLNSFGNIIEVMEESVINEDFPDTIFYRLKPSKKIFKDTPKKEKTKKNNDGNGLLQQSKSPSNNAFYDLTLSGGNYNKTQFELEDATNYFKPKEPLSQWNSPKQSIGNTPYVHTNTRNLEVLSDFDEYHQKMQEELKRVTLTGSKKINPIQ